MERDVELMRCQPLVCAGGGLMPYCCTQTRGGTTVGEAYGPIPPCPSSLPALWLATELQGGRRKKDRFKRAGPSSHPPVRKREASKLQVGAAH